MRACLALVAAVVLLSAGPARAYDFLLSAETIGQGYQLRAGDDTLVNRRRLTQWVGLDVFNLGPTDVYGRARDRNQLYLSLSLRFDAELGDYTTLPQLSGHTPTDELHADRLELLYAFAGGRAIGGVLDFRLGRQVMVDMFSFQSFDGLWLEAKTPFHLALEAWGGLAVSGAAPVDSPVYRSDGVALGGNLRDSLGARQESALLPTFGLAAHTVGLPWLSARVSYLRTASFTARPQPGEPDSGVNEEQLAVTARARLLQGRLQPWVGLRYNVLLGGVDDIQAGLRLQLGRDGQHAHALQAEYVYNAPSFDGDSIWNVFGFEAFNDARLTYDLVLRRFRLYATAFLRRFGDGTLSASGSAAPADLSSGLAEGGAAGARLELGRGIGRGFLRLDGYYEDGYGGTRAGAELSGRLRVLGDWLTGLTIEGRLSYVWFRDDLRPIDHSHSVAFQGGVRYGISRGITLHLAVEENVNRFWASDLRVLALLDLSFYLGPRGGGVPVGQPVGLPW